MQKFLKKGYEIFINSESNAAAGVAICLRIAKEIKVLSIKKDKNDRVIILKLMIEEEIITVVSFYDSNTNSNEFMEWIDSALAEENISQGIIIGGDTGCPIKRFTLSQLFHMTAIQSLKLYYCISMNAVLKMKSIFINQYTQEDI